MTAPVVALVIFGAVIVLLLVARLFAKRIANHIAQQEAMNMAKAFQLEAIDRAAKKKSAVADSNAAEKRALESASDAELERQINE